MQITESEARKVAERIRMFILSNNEEVPSLAEISSIIFASRSCAPATTVSHSVVSEIYNQTVEKSGLTNGFPTFTQTQVIRAIELAMAHCHAQDSKTLEKYRETLTKIADAMSWYHYHFLSGRCDRDQGSSVQRNAN